MSFKLTFNLPTSKRVITETYSSGTDWYRVYSDGWCEQGGYSYPATSTITFLKQFSNIDYTLITQPCNKTATTGGATYMVTLNHTVTGFMAIANTNIAGYEWQACGYISNYISLIDIIKY